MFRIFVGVLVFAMISLSTACNLNVANEEIADASRPDIETPEGAREMLGRLNISYSVDEFVNGARQSDAVAVQLFLTAGMNPAAKDGDGMTALAAANEAGHSKIVELLADAEAEQ